MSEQALPLAGGVGTATQRTKDPAALSRTVVVALIAHLALTGVAIAAELFHLAVVSQFPPDMVDPRGSYLPGEATASLLDGGGALLQLIAYIVCIVLVSKWIYRVSLNAHSLASGMSISPGWNVGFFFIPFANLWLPYKGLRETWAVSADPGAWRTVKVPPLLGWWWGLWIASNIVANIAFRIGLSGGTVGNAIASDLALTVSDIVIVPAGLLLILVVRRLTAVQVEALAGGTFA
jgi:hypothetical protein